MNGKDARKSEGEKVYRFKNWPRRQRWFVRGLFGLMGITLGVALGTTGVGLGVLFAVFGPGAMEWLFDPRAGGEGA